MASAMMKKGGLLCWTLSSHLRGFTSMRPLYSLSVKTPPSVVKKKVPYYPLNIPLDQQDLRQPARQLTSAGLCSSRLFSTTTRYLSRRKLPDKSREDVPMRRRGFNNGKDRKPLGRYRSYSHNNWNINHRRGGTRRDRSKVASVSDFIRPVILSTRVLDLGIASKSQLHLPRAGRQVFHGLPRTLQTATVHSVET